MSPRNCIYCFCDTQDRPLYIGMTVCFFQRLSDHFTDSEWFELVDRAYVFELKRAEKMRQTEARMIGSYKPPYNKSHSRLNLLDKFKISYTDLPKPILFKRPSLIWHARQEIAASFRKLSPERIAKDAA